MTKDTCGTTEASSMRQACMPWGCRSFDDASRRSSMAPPTTRARSSITLPNIWLRRHRDEASHRERFFLHFFAQCTMELLNLREIPLEGRHRIGHLEVVDRQLVASTLIAGERDLRACGCCLREEFRIDQCVGDSVGGKRILEVAGIANESPAGSERLSEESHLSRKPAVPFSPFRPLHNGRQVGAAFPQDLSVSGVHPLPRRLLETALGNRGKYTCKPSV